jgi:polyisoprenyl-phosphate glycosyltransferase
MGERMLSIVSPVRDEAENLAALSSAVADALAQTGLPHELILVDDGSRDGSWALIEELARSDNRVRGVRLSRSFGKDAAIMAGVTEAEGEAVIVLDADMQHPPTLLPELIDRWLSGASVVEAVKRNRAGQPVMARLGAGAFNRIFSRFTGVDLTNATDYRLLSRPVVDALLTLPEHRVFFRGTSTWVGFDRERVEFDTVRRGAGRSRWNLRTLTSFAVRNITAFTSAPLHLVTLAGLVFAAFAVVLAVQTLTRWATGGAVEGFTTVILLLLVQGSLFLLGLGIVGEYLARIHDEVKARPRYVIATRTAREPGE